MVQKLVISEVHARNGDVVVIKEQLNVQALCDSKTSSLGIITLLLGAIRAEKEDTLRLVGESDTVDQRPHVTKTARGELDTRGEAQLRVTWEFRVGISIVEKVLKVEVAIEGRKQILGGNAVAGLVEEGVVELVAGRALKESEKNGNLGDSVERTTANGHD